ncbi:uncharacterized protein LOC122509209 [Leptopilina heterotoma]|uniref:uncharacterized protein LOC122509209 n=1 Tax=Leptopilina heterotoma TaxID=63436 RepID=UPI001CA86BB9|nr:uncharacterized protein LOC122509209 [Leptopilina heterotoma]
MILKPRCLNAVLVWWSRTQLITIKERMELWTSLEQNEVVVSNRLKRNLYQVVKAAKRMNISQDPISGYMFFSSTPHPHTCSSFTSSTPNANAASLLQRPRHIQRARIRLLQQQPMAHEKNHNCLWPV